MDKKKIISILGLLVVLTALVSLFLYLSNENKKNKRKNIERKEDLVVNEHTLKHLEGMSPEIRELIIPEIVKVKNLVDNKAIRTGYLDCSGNNNLTPEEILERDERWVESGPNAPIEECLSDDATQVINDFEIENPEFAETGLVDGNGLIIATSNKTSDYYQADEDWFVVVYDGDWESVHIREIMFNESVGVATLQIIVPVVDKGEIVSVLNTGVELDYIEGQLGGSDR